MKIVKHNAGYVLRQSPFPAAAGGLILGMGLIMAVFSAAFLPAVSGAEEWAATVFTAAFLAAITGTGIYQVVIHRGRRLVLDADGVHLQRTLMKEKFLSWEAVRDLGCTHEDGGYRRRQQRAHYFYVSPVRLGSRGHVIRARHRALLLHVSRAEIDDICAAGVIDFCEEKANEGKEEWDRVVPYFSLPVNRSR